MSDIPEKLRELSRWLLATDTDIKMPDEMIAPELAADYAELLENQVARMKADNERLRAALRSADRLRDGIREEGVKRLPKLYPAVMDFDAARAALAGSLPAEQEKPNE